MNYQSFILGYDLLQTQLNHMVYLATEKYN